MSDPEVTYSPEIQAAVDRLRAFNEANRDSPAAKMMRKQAELRKKLAEELGPDYNKERYGFQVNNAEYALITEWLEELKPEIMELQQKRGLRDPLNQDEPYYGSTGGGLTYSFVATSIGDILTVKEATTGKELNVTAALEWIFFG
jgi:hypothetical protein